MMLNLLHVDSGHFELAIKSPIHITFSTEKELHKRVLSYLVLLQKTHKENNFFHHKLSFASYNIYIYWKNQ